QYKHPRRSQSLPTLQIPLPRKPRSLFPKTTLVAAAAVLTVLVAFTQLRSTHIDSYAVSTPAPTVTPTLVYPARFHASAYTWIPQTWNNTGPANLAQVLGHFGLSISQQQIASILKPVADDKNVSPVELVNFVNQNTELKAIVRVGANLDLVK